MKEITIDGVKYEIYDQNINGVITGVFDKNMNPDKSLDEILVPRFIEYGIGWGATKLGAAIGFAIGGPVGGLIGGVAGAVIGAIASSPNSDEWYEIAKAIVVDKFGKTFEFMDTTIYGKITQEEFMLQELEQNNQTTKDFCVRMYPKFARYVQTYDLNKIDINASSLMAYINKISYDKVKQNLTIQTQNEVDSVSKAKEISQIIAETTKVQTLTINSQTYNIKNLSNLELRNAIENIPQVSFLLSHILIKVGEYLDLGEKGIYKVKSGDTLSTIAQRNGMVTKDLVRLNPWLCDEGRISFNQNKVLIEGNPLDLSNKNHTLYGEANAENVLIDANGGDNEFIGGSKADKMESRGKGYDIYHANDGDEITDNDGKGEVKFGGTALTGGLYNKDKGYYESEDESIEYHLNGNTLIVKNGSESITINNYSQSQESLGIKLEKPATEYAILCDTTGSMSNIISSVKAQAINIVNSIFCKRLKC